VSHNQAYVSQQLAYLGSDVILRLSLCLGVHAVSIFQGTRQSVHIIVGGCLPSSRTLLSCPWRVWQCALSR